MPEEAMTPGWKMYLEGQAQKNKPPQKQMAKQDPNEPREVTPEERALIEQLMKPAFTECPTSAAPLGGSGGRSGGGWKWEVTRG